MTGFVLELTRAEATGRATVEDAVAVDRWLDRTYGESLRRFGPGCWAIQLIRWDGESTTLFEQHETTGDTHWWTPPVPPPASLMRYAERVPR